MSLRTKKMEQIYADARAAKTLMPLAQEPIVEGAPEFAHWKIVANRFPHNRHHSKHVMVVLKRDCALDDVALVELSELWHTVVPWADAHYDYVKLNLSSMRTVNHTPHLHLLSLKPEYK